MKRLKKLLSVVLAGAMALSLCATALATDPTPVTNFNDPDDLGDTIDATSVSEGVVPDKPISVILPVVSERQTGVAQLFDFILDPHNLIVKTNAAAYAPTTEGAATPTFDPNTKLYFASETGAEFTYSGVSKSLTVTNTGFVPLNVDLDLTFDYGTADFDLVDSTAAAAWAEETPAVDIRPEMYLAVVSSDGTKTVLDPADDVDENGVRTAETTVTFTSTNEYLTDVPAFAYTEDYDPETMEEAFDEALAEAAITLTFTPFEAGDPDADPATDDAPANIAIAGDFGDDFDVAFADEEGVAIDDALTEGKTVVATISTEVESEDVEIATVTFEVAIPADEDEEAGTQTISFKAPHKGAVIETALGVLADSYQLAQTTVSDTVTALEAAGVDVTDNGYYWQKVVTENSAYPAFTFHLEGNINEALKDKDTQASPWDKVNAASRVKFDMTWDVAPYSKAMNRTQKTDPAGNTPVADPLPTVTVTTAASGTGTSTKTATLAWAAPSSGKYASCEPTSAKSGNANASPITISNKTATSFKLTASTQNKNSKCIVTFSDGTNSVEVEVDGWYTGT